MLEVRQRTDRALARLREGYAESQVFVVAHKMVLRVALAETDCGTPWKVSTVFG